MVTFDPRKPDQGAAFEHQLARVSALLFDMREIRAGRSPEDLTTEEAPILDRWVLINRPAASLAGLSTGHPKLPGENRLIATSDLWLISEDRQWARTLSRWYRLGRPGDDLHQHS